MIPLQATPTPEQFANASAVTNGFADSSGLIPISVLVGIAAVCLVFLARISPLLAESRILERVFGTLGKSLFYSLKGLATLGVFSVIGAPVYYIATMDGGTRSFALKWIGYAIAGYITLVALGWLADKVVAKYINAHPDLDEFGDILPDAPETDEKVAADGGERRE